MDERRQIPTKVGSLAVRVRGEGPAAVLWHSLFVDERSWQRVEEGLAHDRRLVIITGPGHGASSTPGIGTPSTTVRRLLATCLRRSTSGSPWTGSAMRGAGMWESCSRRPGRIGVGPWPRSGRRSRPTAGPSGSRSGSCSPSTASSACEGSSRAGSSTHSCRQGPARTIATRSRWCSTVCAPWIPRQSPDAVEARGAARRAAAPHPIRCRAIAGNIRSASVGSNSPCPGSRAFAAATAAPRRAASGRECPDASATISPASRESPLPTG